MKIVPVPGPIDRRGRRERTFPRVLSAPVERRHRIPDDDVIGSTTMLVPKLRLPGVALEFGEQAGSLFIGHSDDSTSIEPWRKDRAFRDRMLWRQGMELLRNTSIVARNELMTRELG